MNIHHLELFYYVAKHGGISEAVRNIPYGIQQPAVSSQVIQLEEFLGAPLFQRRPFALTASGAELYEFIRPFFENLTPLADRLRGGAAQQIRVGASALVLRDYLPAILRTVRARFPNLRLHLRDGFQPDLEAQLCRQELDLAITALEAKPSPGLNSQLLFNLPLVLLAPKRSRIKTADELWRQDRIAEPLISLPPNEPIAKNFQDGLRRLGVDWFARIEVSSIDLIETYVAAGFGLGASVAIPQRPCGAGIRALPLPNFAPLRFGLLWRGKKSPLLQLATDAITQAAEEIAAAPTSGVPSKPGS